jgi:hypothetical protein
MGTKDEEVQDSQNPEEDKTSTNDEEKQNSDEKIATLDAQRQKYKEKFEKTTEEFEEYKKNNPPPKEEKVENKEPSDEFGLTELTYLKVEGIKTDEEIDFVTEQLKEANLTKDNLPKLLGNKYFQSALEDFRSTKAKEKATSGIKGSRGTTKATDSVEHWVAKGVPPTKEQVPDRKTRAKIARALIDSSKSSKQFYND